MNLLKYPDFIQNIEIQLFDAVQIIDSLANLIPCTNAWK